MSNKSLIILWALAAGLLALTLNVRSKYRSHSAAESKLEDGAKLLSGINAKQIRQIDISGVGGDYALSLSDNGWIAPSIGDFPVNGAEVVKKITELSDSEVTQPMKTSDKYYERFGLDEADAKLTKVELKDSSGTTLETIFLGDEVKGEIGASTSGRRVRIASDPSTIYSLTDKHEAFDQKISTWLKQDFLSVENIESVRHEVKLRERKTPEGILLNPSDLSLEKTKAEMNFKASHSWLAKRKTVDAPFEVQFLTEGQKSRSSAVSAFSNALKKPEFSEVLGESDIADWHKHEAVAPLHVCEIVTFDGFTYTVQFTAKTSSRKNEDFIFSFDVDYKAKEGASEALDAKFQEQKPFSSYLYVVKKSVIEPFMKKRSDLVSKPQ